VTERDLVEGCQRRDPRAQRALVLRYAPMLLTAARRYVLDHDDAQDVLQNGLIKILDHLPRFRYGEGSFEGWMRRIVVNTALKSLRYPLQYSAAPLREADETAEVKPEVYQQMDADHLLALIDELPDGCRMVFNLFALEGYSHREISDLLQIDESTSRSQLTRARALLRKKLNFLIVNT
jgi:RNA polymerase sigma factor (sigma-70 family)